MVSLGSSLGIRSPQGFSVRLYCITREFAAGVLGASVLYMYYRQNVFSLDRMCSLMAFWVRLFCTCIIVTHTGSIQYQVPIASSSLLTPHPTPLLLALHPSSSLCTPPPHSSPSIYTPPRAAVASTEHMRILRRNRPKCAEIPLPNRSAVRHLLSRGHMALAVTRTRVRGRG